MVIPWCPKTPADHILGTHNGAFGYACLHGIACHTTISIIWHTKKFNLVKWGVELKMNWLNWSIPISWGFQFQFNSNSKSFNSIPIQFMLNWIELIINSNSIHELIRALLRTSSLPPLGALPAYFRGPTCAIWHQSHKTCPLLVLWLLHVICTWRQ